MFKKLLSTLVVAAVLAAPAASYAAPSDWTVNTAKTADGVLEMKVNLSTTSKLKVLVQKGDTKYYYDVQSLADESIPLQMGDGTYTIALLKNVSGTSYTRLDTKTFEATGIQSFEPYMTANPIVDFAAEDNVVALAKKLTLTAKTDEEKIKAIYTYVSKSFSYDYNRAKTVQSGYVPDVDAVLAANAGICYDYSAVMAAMLRSVGVPAKVNMGYSKHIAEYHAWNEVYLKSADKWITLDTTYDSAYLKAGRVVSMIKNSADFTVLKSY
ncbi:transglutaminase-like domain-containing protein [Acidaminobacter hydrogenoformans]|uniref:Transglutaminase-like superfamily protein n=1 Tax=Acidaminobacter hydrogenoformans DSM 2784 TaxID=1120920 RepID=A0A1G5RQW9_9FIRM|nr:transglutaminase-like domain-containing protein [Acidaminobacter hydrogenoformans]SCZ76396.1 Transglutaminase-like superfamily protein [Acidaminobacter hydrogenoformans DSM 2784]